MTKRVGVTLRPGSASAAAFFSTLRTALAVSEGSFPVTVHGGDPGGPAVA